jgi:hypothetical protein
VGRLVVSWPSRNVPCYDINLSIVEREREAYQQPKKRLWWYNSNPVSVQIRYIQ